MGEKLKSAFELAMERLKAKEGEGAPLSDEQKARIAEVRAEYRKRRSEMEFLHRAAVAEADAAQNPETRARLEDDFLRETARLSVAEEEAVQAIRETP